MAKVYLVCINIIFFLFADQEVPVLVTRVEVNETKLKTKRSSCTGRFLTMHKRRKKRLLTRSLRIEAALLDDLQFGQVQASGLLTDA